MGTGKKEKSRIAREGKSGDGMRNIKVKGENFYRSAKKLKTLNMRKDGKPVRNAEGTIVQAASYQSREVPKARIEPNRRWFNSSRVISQDSLSAFRDAMAEKANDPYQVLLKSNKLPMSLIKDGSESNVNGLKTHKAKMTIESSPFSDVFGPKSQRKRVKLSVSNMADLADDTEQSMDGYKARLEQARLLSGNRDVDIEESGEYKPEEDGVIATAIEPIFSKGQSKRIYNELYKVLDASDVVLHVLDARDPEGTRCRSIEKYLNAEAPHKHLVFVLNKTDLVPTSVAAAWVRHLSKDRPTLAFHSSITNPFGKGSLIQLLRQFAALHKDRKEISVGIIGYPNVGKSSIINTLRKKKVANVAPIPGETKVWQYVTLMGKIQLIDCPGVVPPNAQDRPEDVLLRGVVRVEKVENPEQYIPRLFEKVKQHHLERTYELKGWTDHLSFLEMLARKGGRLLKGGEPDVDGTAKMVITDFNRGRIPWFTPAPVAEAGESKAFEGREGRLGEMPRKRKRDDSDATSAVEQLNTTNPDEKNEDSLNDVEEEFEGFDSDDEAASGEDSAASDAEEEDGDSDDMIPLEELSDVEDDGSSDGEEENG